MTNKKAKKITNKEFKRVFNECYGDFDIWGYEGLLNIMCLSLTYQIKELKKLNPDMTSLILREEERRKKLWDYLEEIGFFDD